MLHDSKGFEAGEVDNFNKVKRFISRRAQEPLIKDRLHAVWYVAHTALEKFVDMLSLGYVYKFLTLTVAS